MHLLLLLLLAQQEKTAFRTEKTPYVLAIRACREAELLIQADPQRAINKLDPVIANSKLKKIECRLRVETQVNVVGPYNNFFPYQFRGRARMNLARKSEPEVAERLLRGAVNDFKVSVTKGLAASRTYEKQAQVELAKVRAAMTTKPPPPPRTDPVEAFRRGWQPLVDRLKFKSARAYIDKQGKALPTDKRADFIKQTESRCLLHVRAGTDWFRGRFALIQSVSDLTRMGALQFATTFDLPDPAELAVTTPEYDWARAHLADLRRVRAREAGGEALLKPAAAAARLIPKGENVWFDTAERLAYEGVRGKLKAAVDAAQDAPHAERARREGEADALLKKWTAFESGLEAPFRGSHPIVQRHRGELDRLRGGFPIDLAELGDIDLEACISAPSPEAELVKAEKILRALTFRSGITRESRRNLYTVLVTAIALRLFLEGKNEDEALSAVEPYRRQLAGIGGPVNPREFGPRVEKVFEKLR